VSSLLEPSGLINASVLTMYVVVEDSVLNTWTMALCVVDYPTFLTRQQLEEGEYHGGNY
jgi:hypothetical protein